MRVANPGCRVDYPSTTGHLDTDLMVNTGSLGDAVEFLTTDEGCVLSRDAVAALVGQLQSWLGREGKGQ